jgi:hypothetical protein
MASTLKHLRSSTTDKRPTASGLAEGQLALNTASGTPALFFKDNGGGVVKVGPAHVGGTAPNASPAGSAGNSMGELWVDNGTTINGLKYYDGSVFVNLTPSGSTTVPGLVELATNAETQAGTDTVRAVTPSGLQSKISDSISTTSSTTIASATAVKTAYDLANAALPRSGGSVTGELLIAPSGSLVFEGSTNDGFETTLAVTDPTADRIITLPNTTGTVITTGDTGTVTSTMIVDGTIVNADINASAAIVDTKLATIATAGKVSNSATTATSANTASAIVARDGSGNFTANVITASLTGNVTGNVTGNLTGTASAIADDTVTSAKIVDGAIVNADVNASAAIAGTKISPNFGSQNIVTTGTATASGFIPTGSSVPTNGMYLPAANQLGFSTNGTGRLFVDASGRVGIGTSTPVSPLTIIGAVDGVSFGTNTTSLASSTANGVFSPTGNQLGFTTNATERVRIDTGGRLLVGTSVAYSILGFQAGTQLAAQDGTVLCIRNTENNAGTELNCAKSRGTVGAAATVVSGDTIAIQRFAAFEGTSYVEAARVAAQVDGTPGTNDMPGRLVFSTTADGGSTVSERMRIDSSGRVGIGATSPTELLQVGGNIFANGGFVRTAGAGGAAITTRGFRQTIDGTEYLAIYHDNTGAVFNVNGSERARIDSSGRLLVGASSARSNYYGSVTPGGIQLETGTQSLFQNSNNAIGSAFYLGKSRGATVNSNTVVQAGDQLGAVIFFGADGTNVWPGAQITAEVDGTPGANDMPGRLVFSTTADGAASPTERMRIDNAGNTTWNGVGLKLTTGRNISATVDNSSINILGGDITTNPGANIELYGGTHVSFANTMILDANEHRFRTANGVTERMRIDSSGNVGIGGVPGSYRLDVLGSGGQRILNQGGGSFLEIGQGTTTNQPAYIDLIGDTTYADFGFRIIRNGGGANANTEFVHRGTGDLRLYTQDAAPITFYTANAERARIDTSGRLLVGTSASITAVSFPSLVQSNSFYSYQSSLFSADANGSNTFFLKSRNATTGSHTVVQANDVFGQINFAGSDGANFVSGANIAAAVDGTPGTNDMPGRLVFSTTADGAASPTEQLRISNGGTVIYNQPAPAAVDVTATLTVANLTAKIITSSTAAAVTMTLPTGTLMDGGFSGLYNNMAFEWSVINTGATNAVTVQGGTGHTLVGSGTVAANNSQRFLSRRTAATTWVTYRLT